MSAPQIAKENKREKINTIKTTYTCDTKLFGPVEAFYNSGGEEGGLMFGGGATYEK